VHYELWDTASGNLLDDFDTLALALAEVLRYRNPGSTEDLHHIALLEVDDRGQPNMVAQGQTLLSRAQGEAPDRSRQLA
jgi:hypothetical protein